MLFHHVRLVSPLAPCFDDWGLHVGVAVGGLVDVGLGDDEEDLLHNISALAF